MVTIAITFTKIFGLKTEILIPESRRNINHYNVTRGNFRKSQELAGVIYRTGYTE
jgi:hypothetical protein